MKWLLVVIILCVPSMVRASGIFNPGGSGGAISNISDCGTTPPGIEFTDTDGCTWCTTVATTGNLVTTFETCPVSTADQFRACIEGEPIGLTLAFVCGKHL